ncbi:hypothetical protein CHS0354_028018 [Potamilus streckersoni]|uniref:Uncharacterized protein n=1 Tax=Potamilus streckersoni TaxID=2493646 RepID=A0AAE0VEU0_9BIVA|nr:hypothetical protein CHS0354_028018 [Potamilus streckersoni]
MNQIQICLFMDPGVFLKWWFSWTSNMKMDLRKPCPGFGFAAFAPKQLACHGPKVEVGFSNANFEEESKPDTVEPVLKDHPFCQNILVSHDRWSLITGHNTI